MHRLSLALVAALWAVFAQGARADSLLTRYPHTDTFVLANGDEVALPLHIQAGRGVVLAGFAELDALAEVLAPEGLRPIAVAPGKGFIALYNMNYERTDLGAYRELVIVIAATRDTRVRPPLLDAIDDYAGLLSIYVPLLRGAIGDRSLDVLYTWKLYVTEDLPLRAGREVWGFPKTLADIDVQVTSRAASFEVEDEGELVLRGSFRRLLPVGLPVSVDSFLATPLALRPSITHGMADTTSRFGLFMPWDDFELNTAHPWGRALHDVGFAPLLWHGMSALESVFLAPED